METYIFRRKDYKTYQDFYRDIAKKMNAKDNIEVHYPEDFNCEYDWLWEFLWGCRDEDSVHIILIGFDVKKIKKEETIFDWGVAKILDCFEDLPNECAQNIVEYRDDDDDKE